MSVEIVKYPFSIFSLKLFTSFAPPVEKPMFVPPIEDDEALNESALLKIPPKELLPLFADILVVELSNSQSSILPIDVSPPLTFIENPGSQLASLMVWVTFMVA